MDESKKKKLKRLYENACRKSKEKIERKKKLWQRIKQKKAETTQLPPAVIEKRKYHKETPVDELEVVHDRHFKRRVLERVHDSKYKDDAGVEMLKLIFEYKIASGDALLLGESHGVIKYIVRVGERDYIVVYSLKTQRYVTLYEPIKRVERSAYGAA